MQWLLGINSFLKKVDRAMALRHDDNIAIENSRWHDKALQRCYRIIAIVSSLYNIMLSLLYYRFIAQFCHCHRIVAPSLHRRRIIAFWAHPSQIIKRDFPIKICLLSVIDVVAVGIAVVIVSHFFQNQWDVLTQGGTNHHLVKGIQAFSNQGLRYL